MSPLVLQGIASGIVTGCVYALIALSLVIVYKSSDVINFAGGEIVMLGGYLGMFALLFLGLPYWLVFNIGDSRAYLHTGHELRQISVDHSVVQELVDAGQLTQDRARFHPERHIVTRAVGTPATPQPDFWLVPREPGDRMLLCSDGITSELGDDDIAAALGRPDPAQRVAENLTALALRAGGRDNITCIVVDALPLGDRVGAAPDEDRDETRPRHRPDSLGVGR